MALFLFLIFLLSRLGENVVYNRISSLYFCTNDLLSEPPLATIFCFQGRYGLAGL